MQVFGLPGHVIRNGRAATRLFDAKPHEEAARRRDAVARWRRAMADGLSAETAAHAVGVARPTLYRWEKAPEPKSRRPKGLRRPKWPPALVEAVEALRADNPMWGKRKIAKLIANAPFEVKGIQVDGGSEFRSLFEDHCQAKGLELVVLPPKRPDLNGCVERAPSSWRYEFYPSYDLPVRIDKLQPLVDAFAHRYNHHRPTKPLATSPQPSISDASARRPQRLISAELAHPLDTPA